jgi:signal transduction histidine kinase
VFFILNGAIMLPYLFSGWLQRRLEGWFLVVGLLLVSIGAEVTQWVEIQWTLHHGMPPEAIGDILASSLFIPLVIITVQYGLKAMFAFTLGTAAIDSVFVLTVFSLFDPPAGAAFLRIVVRVTVFLIAGFIILRVVGGQKTERKSLKNKNIQLTEYATTIERLAISHERNRMARELHDTLAHTLSAVSLQLAATRKQIDTDPEGAKKSLSQSRTLIHNGLEETRRALEALRASPLEDLGLRIAIQQLVEVTKDRWGIGVDLEIGGEVDTLAPEIEQSIYRIADEALNNAARHARAEHIAVMLRRSGRVLELTVTDYGNGFDPDTAPSNGHYGLAGMRERAALCNGQLSIESQLGSGTVVRLKIES